MLARFVRAVLFLNLFRTAEVACMYVFVCLCMYACTVCLGAYYLIFNLFHAELKPEETLREYAECLRAREQLPQQTPGRDRLLAEAYPLITCVYSCVCVCVFVCECVCMCMCV